MLKNSLQKYNIFSNWKYFFFRAFFFRIFALGFGRPQKGAKREAGANPAQSRCCEFQLVSHSKPQATASRQSGVGRPEKGSEQARRPAKTNEKKQSIIALEERTG